MKYIKCKGMLNGMGSCNPYRGCSHGCIYCDSRSTCYQIMDFDNIEVKENAAEVLDAELGKKRKKFVVKTGSMCDPYLPVERELGITRGLLQVIAKRKFGVGMLTKSDLILRDMELYRRINAAHRAVVCFTITTINDDLCRCIERSVCPTSKRLDALSAFSAAGIDTGVWLCPILPFINDTEENVVGIVEASYKAGVKYIVTFGFGTTMRSGSREYFYRQLDAYFPGVKERYIAAFGDRYECPSPHADALYASFAEACRKHGILYRWQDIDTFLYGEKTEQLKLF